MYFPALSPTYTLQTQQILIRTDKLLQSGTILETLKHTDHTTIHTLMGKIKQLMTDFDDRLGKRKKKIDESVQLHKLTELVRTQLIYGPLTQGRLGPICPDCPSALATTVVVYSENSCSLGLLGVLSYTDSLVAG